MTAKSTPAAVLSARRVAGANRPSQPLNAASRCFDRHRRTRFQLPNAKLTVDPASRAPAARLRCAATSRRPDPTNHLRHRTSHAADLHQSAKSSKSADNPSADPSRRSKSSTRLTTPVATSCQLVAPSTPGSQRDRGTTIEHGPADCAPVQRLAHMYRLFPRRTTCSQTPVRHPQLIAETHRRPRNNYD